MKRLEELLTVPVPQRTDEEWEAHDARVERERVERQRGDEERAREERYRQLVAWGVPHRDVRLIATTSLWRTAALSAVKRPFGILVLSGSTGCGKTTAAAWWLADEGPVAGERYRQPLAPMFLSVARFGSLSRFDETRMRQAWLARKLVLDDLGAEYADERGAFVQLVDAIVNERYANELPLVITTNLSREEFRERYGERVADRIRHDGRFISTSEPSLRRKENAKP